MIFPALIAKLLSAGAVAQAATGAAVVVVVATGAGATGVLGEDVRTAVTSVVGVTSEDGTEEEVVAGDDGTAQEVTVGEPLPEVAEEVVEEDVVVDAQTWIDEGPEDYGSFSAWVTAGAHDPDLKDELRAMGRNFGSVVRDWAGWKGMSEEELAAEGIDVDALDEPAGVPAPEPVAEPEAESTTDAGNQAATTGRGNGKSNGTGNGNGAGGSAVTRDADGGNGNAAKGNGRN